MSIERSDTVRHAYQWCRTLAASHYENFPVASWLLPATLRDPVAAIYAFARTADDIADEGEDSEKRRLDKLGTMQSALNSIASGATPAAPLYYALADTIDRYQLPLQLFGDLLSAFRQDISKRRYADFGEVIDYCRRSANPIGRLFLLLSGHATDRNLAMSDAVCSALQLINFLQDIDQDYRENDRIYIPQDEMQRFGVSEDDIRHRQNGPRLTQLVRFQCQRTAQLLRAGSPLGSVLPGRFGLELRSIVLAGSRVLQKLQKQNDVFSRPRLNAMDRGWIIWAACTQGFK